MTIERNERESYILDVLAREGSLSVSALAPELGVSEVTVRSMLRALEERGMLSRTRGGAEASSIRNVLERAREHAEAKGLVAAAAAGLVTDDDRIMIEAGTTTSLVVPQLSGRKGVQIVTNSTLVFAHARLNPALSITLTGGVFHRETESLVGPAAQRLVREFNVRLAFVGTDGFSVERGMTTQFSEGAQMLTAMHERAEQTWLLADSSKFGRSGFVSVLPLDRLAGIITDSRIADEALTQLRDCVPQVRVVPERQ